MPITLAQIQPELMNYTESFLRHYLLRLVGNHPYSGTTDAWLVDRASTVPGVTTGRSGRQGKVKQRPWIDFELGYRQPHTYAGAGVLSIWYISMRQMNEQPVDTHFALPHVGGPDIMMTSGLSGCSFGIGIPSAGAQIVSHIQPPNALGGTAGMNVAQLDPVVQAGLQAGQMALFSRNTRPDYADKASIIGVRRGGRWSFYAQTISGTVGSQSITGSCRFA
jgi:hypothetical protein